MSNPHALTFKDVARVFRRRERAAGLAASLKAFVSPTYVDKVAVNDLSFEVTAGSCTGLVGANGAGKTTLLKMAAGLLHPTRGQVNILGYTPHERDPEYLRRIGMVMGQKSQLWSDIPAAETFELLAAIYDIPRDVYQKRVAELAAVFGVEKLLGVQVRRLSLGERMKCEIIASLLHGPDLLFLDEPTIGLDVMARHNIRSFLVEHRKRTGATIILSSHDMADIVELCDSLLFIHEGKLLYSGSLDAFNAQHGGNGGAKDLETLVREIMSRPSPA